MKRNWLIIGPAALLGIVLVTFIGGEAVRLLWNWLLPSLGLLALCRILFGGVGLRGSSRADSSIRRRMADRMADRVAERWEHMTPEERDRFRQRIRERCGFDPSPSGTTGQ
jgi:hypothetical protein